MSISFQELLRFRLSTLLVLTAAIGLILAAWRLSPQIAIQSIMCVVAFAAAAFAPPVLIRFFQALNAGLADPETSSAASAENRNAANVRNSDSHGPMKP